MSNLPTGTVTFLFTDIEGSTRLLEALGNAYSAVLERHHALLREAIASGGGTEVSTEGDAFFAVFPSAPRALAAAVEAQRALAAVTWPVDAQVRVRMGLHTGEGTLGGDNYLGLAVHRAARVAAAAHGGQILLSGATASLTAPDLPPGVRLRELGTFRLRDLTDPETLHQANVEGLPDAFPKPRTLDVAPNNLPTQLTTFLGREPVLKELLAILPQSRLLTLTGPGGTGKTRLSLEVAGRVLDHFPGGVYFVALGSVSQPELVPTAVAQAIELPDPGGKAVTDRIIERLQGKPTLLILDNFEQVEAAAPFVTEVLTGAPTATIIVTTRNVLHLYGEREFPVPPMSLPDPRHLTDVASMTQFEAVALFVERAIAVRPDFRVTNENAPAVAQICVRLDGLPLAIELVAARLRLLTPQAMLDRLGQSLDLARSGARDVPERQQTLRGAIAWSHEMLPEADASLFATLSVFSGGAGLEEIEALAVDPVGGDVLDGLGSLVDKSLLRQAEGHGGEPRFSMLETIREFAAEQLDASGRRDDARARHGAIFCSLAGEASADIMGPRQRDWLDRLEQEHDNLREAITWTSEAGQTEAAMMLVANLWRFWQMRGYLVEGYERALRVLALPGVDGFPEALEGALEAAGGLAYWLGNGAAAGHYERALAIAQQMGDRSAEARQWYNLSGAYGLLMERSPESMRLTRDAANRATQLYRELGDSANLGRALWAQANTHYEAGEEQLSMEALDEAMPLLEAAGDRFMVAWGRFMRALFHIMRNDLASARRELEFALREFHAAGDVSGYTLVLDGFAQLAFKGGDLDRAARLSGFVAHLEVVSGTGLNAANRKFLGFEPEQLRDRPATSAAWEAGERMGADEAVALALLPPTTPETDA